MGMARLRALQRFFISLLTLVAFVATQLPMRAFAQNSAQAEVLFKEGQTLMVEKKYPEACQRLTASFKLDPQPNTELVQGECFKKLGKTASAYNAYIDASSSLPRGEAAQKYAADQAHALEPSLLKVRVQVSPIVPGLSMKFDDDTKGRDKDFIGIDIALDPGEHDLTITAPGKHDFTKHFTLDAASSPHNVIANLTDKTKEELDAERGGGGGGNGGGNGGGGGDKPEVTWSTVKTLGLITTIIGGVAIAGAVVAQILALVDHSNATNLQSRANTASPGICPTLSGTSPNSDCASAISYQTQALGSQGAAIGIGIAGGVVLIAGIVMFLVGGNTTTATAKPEPPKASFHFSPWATPQGAGMGVFGTF